MGLIKKFFDAPSPAHDHGTDNACGWTRGDQLAKKVGAAALAIRTGGAVCGRCTEQRRYGTCGCSGQGR